MMRSLFSGVTGLRAHQTRMDVIGNNIANVNTIGFKCARVTFKDVLYQTVSNSANPTADRAGTNPYQIGYGVQVASIDTLNVRANFQMSDRPYDCYIDGEGYFQVSDSSGNIYYTRVGNFSFDTLGRLHDANGNFVYGASYSEYVDTNDDGTHNYTDIDFTGFGDDFQSRVITIKDLDKYKSVQINSDGTITGIKEAELDADGNPVDPDAAVGKIVVIGQIMLYKFINNDALQQVGSTYLTETQNSGSPILCTPGLNGAGPLVTNGLEMSNVDLSKEFTEMIIAQRGFQAQSRIITVSDEMLQELVNLKR